jgi:hypothetical protein
MKTQFGDDTKRENYDTLLKLITVIIFTIVLSMDVFEIIGGRKTLVEALRSDWVFIFLLIGSFAWPYALYIALVGLPIVVWLQLDVKSLSWAAITQASWSVWMPAVIWLLYATLFLVMAFTGKLFLKPDKVAKL